MRKRLGLFIVATLLLSFVFAVPALGAEKVSLDDALQDIVSYVYEKNTVLNWEEVVGLANAGEDLTSASWQLPDWKVNELNESSPATDYASTILGMRAAEQNPTSVDGRNLVQELAVRQAENGRFGSSINDHLWSMIALEEAGANYNTEKAIDYLLAQQLGDGGFAWSKGDAESDITGFALIALAPHMENGSVSEAVDRAKECLQNLQLDTGGFSSWGSETAESIAAVIRGLVACDEDITTGAWTKNGKTMIDALFAFQLDDCSFAHIIGENGNDMATRQALLAVADMVKAGISYIVTPGGESGETDPEEATVRVRVEGATESLADNTVTLNGTAMDALKKAVGPENVEGNGMLVSIYGIGSGRIDEGLYTSWMYYVIRDGKYDPAVFSTAIGEYKLKNGDEIIFYIAANQVTFDEDWNMTLESKTHIPIVNVNPQFPTAGQSVTFKISAKKFDMMAGKLKDLSENEIKAIGDYTVKVGEDEYTSSYGTVTIYDVSQNTLEYVISNVNELGYSDVVTCKGSLQVQEPQNCQVRVRVEGAVKSLADKTVTVKGTALDALKSAVGEENVTAPGGYLTEILQESGQKNVAENTDTGWMYYVIRDGEIEPGSFMLGADGYNVKDDDQVVFYIGANDSGTWTAKTYLPVVEVTPQSPAAGQDVTISIAAKKNVWGQLLDITAEEAAVIGEYILKAGENEYTSSAGKVTIPNVSNGSLQYTITNANKTGYPNVVTYKGSIQIGSSGVPSEPDKSITVEIAVVGKNGDLLYGPGRVEVFQDNEYGYTVIGALDATHLSYSFHSHFDGFIVEIGGETNEGQAGWCAKVNERALETVPTESEISPGDRIIWWFSTDAYSRGPSWSDVCNKTNLGPVTDPEKAKEEVKKTLEKYKKELAGFVKDIELETENKVAVLNTDNIMTPEEAANLKKELDKNNVSLREEIDGEGGLLFDNAEEVVMQIPENALSQRKMITIEETESEEQLQKAGIKIGSAIYEFGPSGTKFSQTVTICIKIPITDDVDVKNLTPAWYDADKGEWVPIPAVIDLETGLVVFQIDHFTQFAVIELAATAEEVPVEEETAETPTTTSFADVNASYAWAKAAVETLTGQGIINGTGSGFEPGRSINRAEMLAMLKRALKIDNREAELNYSDVSADDWFYNDVKTAAAYKWMSGYPDGTFRPYAPITRNETACLLARMTDLDAAAEDTDFKDKESIPAWAIESVKYVQTRGLMGGYPDGSFSGERNLTRAEAAVAVYKYLTIISE